MTRVSHNWAIGVKHLLIFQLRSLPALGVGKLRGDKPAEAWFAPGGWGAFSFIWPI